MDAALAAAQGDKKLLSDINALQNRIYTALPAASGNRRDKRNVSAVAGKGDKPKGKKKARFTSKLDPDVRYDPDVYRTFNQKQRDKLYAIRPPKDEVKASGSAASVPNSKYESLKKERDEYKRKVAELTSEQKSGRSNSRSRSSSASPSPAKRSSSKSRAIHCGDSTGLGDQVVSRGHVVASLRSVRLNVSIMSTSSVTCLKSELDSHADTCVVGKHALVVHEHNKMVNVFSYDPKSKGVDALVKYVDPFT
eukprot:scaffold4423_cov144-Alexandrium_tamarense.AAC.2